jgi:hypothetical protein
MARVNELLNNGRTDKACSTSDENTHDDFSFTSFHDRIRGPVIIKMVIEEIRSSCRVRFIFAIVRDAPMDPLSDVLSLLKLRSYSPGGFDVAGELSVQFPQLEGIKCYALVSGQCWLSMEGVPDALPLETGDSVLLPRGRPFRLASDLTLTPVDALTIFATALNGGIGSYNGGGDCFIVSGHFALTGNHASILLGMLPPVVHIRKESDKAAMRWSLEQMRQELREPQSGGFWSHNNSPT